MNTDAFLQISDPTLAKALAAAFADARNQHETAVCFRFMRSVGLSLADPASYFSAYRAGGKWRRGSWRQLKHEAEIYLAYHKMVRKSEAALAEKIDAC